jgi:hypothetical protein
MPSQPNANKGLLILLDPNAKDASISGKNVFFVFQYNPEKLLHTFNPAMALQTATTAALEPQGPPSEYLSLTFELDSVDVDQPNQESATLGVHPALAMLELMMQPQVVNNQTTMPIVVFRWGTKREVPVRIVSMNVDENLFDAALNPTRANVSLTLRVLDQAEIKNNQGARVVATGHQSARVSLVEAYKWQTGQASPKVAGVAVGTKDNQSISAAEASSSNVQPKKKTA